MDENEQKVGETENEALNSENSQEAADAETEATDSNVENEEDVEVSDTNEAGFEEKLQKERERLGKKVDKEREKRIAAEKGSLSREEANRLIDEKVGQLGKQMRRDRAELIAERMAKSPAERELIMLHYDNSIIPTGNLEEDMERAYALANFKQSKGRISELETSLKSKKTVSFGASDAGKPAELPKPRQKFSQEIIDGAKFAGKTPEEFAKELGKEK